MFLSIDHCPSGTYNYLLTYIFRVLNRILLSHLHWQCVTVGRNKKGLISKTILTCPKPRENLSKKLHHQTSWKLASLASTSHETKWSHDIFIFYILAHSRGSVENILYILLMIILYSFIYLITRTLYPIHSHLPKLVMSNISRIIVNVKWPQIFVKLHVIGEYTPLEWSRTELYHVQGNNKWIFIPFPHLVCKEVTIFILLERHKNDLFK